MNNNTPLKTVALDVALSEWSIETIFGEEVPSLSSYQGKPLLIIFFSLGCPGCLGRAIPYANRVVYENGDKIDVLGIHTDFLHTGYVLNQFTEAKEEFYIRFPFYKDGDFDSTFRGYGAGGTPHWILLDKAGVVKYSLFGSDPNNALLKLDYKIAEVLESSKH